MIESGKIMMIPSEKIWNYRVDAVGTVVTFITIYDDEQTISNCSFGQIPCDKYGQRELYTDIHEKPKKFIFLKS